MPDGPFWTPNWNSQSATPGSGRKHLPSSLPISNVLSRQPSNDGMDIDLFAADDFLAKRPLIQLFTHGNTRPAGMEEVGLLSETWGTGDEVPAPTQLGVGDLADVWGDDHDEVPAPTQPRGGDNQLPDQTVGDLADLWRDEKVPAETQLGVGDLADLWEDDEVPEQTERGVRDLVDVWGDEKMPRLDVEDLADVWVDEEMPAKVSKDSALQSDKECEDLDDGEEDEEDEEDDGNDGIDNGSVPETAATGPFTSTSFLDLPDEWLSGL